MTAANSDELARQGAAALRAGRPADARAAFLALASVRPDSFADMGLALAEAALDNAAAAHAAADRVLAADPRNLRALLLKADLYDRAGASRPASAHYLAVVRHAEAAAGRLTPDFAREIDRARAQAEAYGQRFTDALRTAVETAGGATPRMRAALDLLAGKRQRYVQEPRYFFFPGLPQIEFYPRESFPWLPALEAHTGAIRDELLRVLAEDGAFTPYVQGDPNRPRTDYSGMLNNPAWSAFFLWKNGAKIPEAAARCPATLAALDALPIAQAPNRSPSILFSLLRPGARIPPHHGMVNTRLICHLPLIIPPGCTLRVGGETREWVEGQAWVFDDTIEHEAANPSPETRVILLFDIERPEITDLERASLRAMFAAIDEDAGAAPAWEI